MDLRESRDDRSQGDAALNVLIALLAVAVLSGLLLGGYWLLSSREGSAPNSHPAEPQSQITAAPATVAPATEALQPDPAPSPVADPRAPNLVVATFSGIVTDELQVAVPGATVHWFDSAVAANLRALPHSFTTAQSTSSVLRATSDATGHYSLQVTRTIESGVAGSLYAEARGFAPGLENADLPLGGGAISKNLVVTRGLQLSGTVWVRGSGEPAVGMKVVASPDSGKAFSFMQFNSPSDEVDEDGHFLIGGLDTGTYRVAPLNNGTAFVSVAVQSAPTATLSPVQESPSLTIQVDAGGTVTGAVRDGAGAPLVGASVVLQTKSLLEAAKVGAILPESQTGQDGTFELRGIPFGRELVARARAAEFATSDPVTIQCTLENPDTSVEFILGAGATITGTVTDVDGEPVSDVRVYAFPDWAAVMSGEVDMVDLNRSVRSDGLGHFAVDGVRDGSYTLMAGDHNYSPMSPSVGGVKVIITDQQDVTDIALVASGDAEDDSSSLLGEVVDDRGDPVAGVTLQGTGVRNGMPAVESAHSSEDGTFALPRMKDMSIQLTAIKKGYSTTTLKDVRGQTVVTLILPRAASVSGRVLGPSGEPIQGSELCYRRHDIDPLDFTAQFQASMAAEWTAAEDDGTFLVPDVAVGSISIVARAPGFAETESLSLTTEPGGALSDVNITLSEGATLMGQVLLPGGGAAEGAEVRVKPDTGGEGSALMNRILVSSSPADAIADEHGMYEITRLMGGQHEVFVTHPDHAPPPSIQVELRTGELRRLPPIALLVPGVIAGLAVDADGTLRSGLMVQVFGPAGRVMKTTDAEGLFQVGGLSPGAYSVVITDMAAFSAGNLVIKFRSVDVTSGSTLKLKFEYGRGAHVRGTITGLTTAGGMQAIYVLDQGAPSSSDYDPFDLDSQAQFLKHIRGTGLVRADGSFDIADVAPGSYRLEIPRTPDNPTDPAAYRDLDRTPVHTQKLEVSDDDLELEIKIR